MQEETLRFHPKNILFHLILIGISALFLSLLAAWLYNSWNYPLPSFRLPWLFLISTVLLLSGSYQAEKYKEAFQSRDTRKYARGLSTMSWISGGFIFSQMVSWKQFYNLNTGIIQSNSVSYLYLLSGLHLVHILIAIPFLAYFFLVLNRFLAGRLSAEAFYFSEDSGIYIRIFCKYWHYLDALWILLLVSFSLLAFL